MTSKFFALLIAVLIFAPLVTFGDDHKYAVVVHIDNKTDLSDLDIARIYLGKIKRFPKNGKVVPLMQPRTTEIGKAFLREYLRKQPSQYNSYWLDMIFTGKGRRPEVISDEAKLRDRIAKDRHAIGLVKITAVDERLRIVAMF